jgi:hypothetical protein
MMLMVMRSFTTIKMEVPLKDRKAAERLLETVKKKYGYQLRLRLRGKSLIVEGEGVQNYRIRTWILKNAGA